MKKSITLRKQTVTKPAKVSKVAKRVQHPRYIVGIDVSNATFAATVLQPGKQQRITRDDFANTTEGSEAFLVWIREQGATTRSTQICMENTGVYGQLLSHMIYDAKWCIAVEVPMKVKRSFTRAIKSDAVDSLQIAEYAMRFADQLTPWMPASIALQQIHSLLSAREQFVKVCTALQNARTAKLRAVNAPTVIETNFSDAIKACKKSIKAIEKEIESIINANPDLKRAVELLRTIPGVQTLLAANLISATGGTLHERTPEQLGAWLGVCPHEHTSGTSVRSKPKSTGHGNARIRKLLHLAARSLKTHNKEMQRYFQQKVREGKHPSLILNNIANRLLRWIVGILKSGKPFNLNHVSTRKLTKRKTLKLVRS